jgi:hypothetical protein
MFFCSWDTAQDSLLQYFGRFGEVIDCVVMKNAETGKTLDLKNSFQSHNGVWNRFTK